MLMFRSLYEKWLNSVWNNPKDNKIRNFNDLFNLDYLVTYWQEELIGRCQRLFIWDNLPFPQRELENLILCNGYCAFVESNKFLVNKYGVAPCTFSGVTEYYDVGKEVRWVTPLDVGKFNMQKGKGVLIRNNSLSRPINNFILRYAIIFANIDISFICALVNERNQNVLMAESQNVADSINNMYQTLEEFGKRKAIVNEKLFQALQGAGSLPTVNNKDVLKPLIECYDAVYQMFYNDIGIRYNKEKKERMVSSEVESDAQRLLINIKDMLECREKACEEINAEFGLNISVKMSNEIVLAENSSQLESKKDSSQLEKEEPKTAEEQKENVDYSF